MQQGFSKFKRFSFKQPKKQPFHAISRQGYSGGGTVQGDGGPYGTWIDGQWHSSGNSGIEVPRGDDPNFEPTPIPSGGDSGGPSPTEGGNSSGNYTPPMDIPLTTPGDFNFNNVADGSYRGPGSGYPTRNVIGLLAGAAGNMIAPGAGVGTGALAKWITSMFQHRPNNAMPTPPKPQSYSRPGLNARMSSDDRKLAQAWSVAVGLTIPEREP